MNLNPIISRIALLQIFMLIMTWLIVSPILKGYTIMHGPLNPFSSFFHHHVYCFLLIPVLWTVTAWLAANFAPALPDWAEGLVFSAGSVLIFAFPFIGYLAVHMA